MGFTILQYNCGGGRAAMNDFGQEMCSSGAAFALVQEPYVLADGIRGLPMGMRVFADLKGDSAIVVNDARAECTVRRCSDYGVCIEVELDEVTLFLVSSYFRFSEPIDPYLYFLDSLLPLVGSNPVIMGMDANAASPLWFSKSMSLHAARYDNHRRGEVFSEYLVARELHPLNVRSEWYTFTGPNGNSDIDVTVANGAAISSFHFEWTVFVGGLSDHNIIKIVCTCARTVRPTVIVRDIERRWITKGANWAEYIGKLHECAANVPLHDFRPLSIDEQVHLVKTWAWHCNDALLRRSTRLNVRSVSWWSQDLSEKKRLVRRLRKQFQRSRQTGASNSIDLGAVYRQSLKEYKAEILEAKTRNWRDFVEHGRDDPWGQVYRICRRGSENAISSSLPEEQRQGAAPGSRRDWIDSLLRSFFPVAGQEAAMSHIPFAASPRDWVSDELHIGAAMARQKSRKSPGLDGLTGGMCKSIWSAIPEYLRVIYEGCFEHGYFPLEWRKARVTVLLKSPDRDRSLPSSYRGISLLPVLGKVLERIMVQRLQEAVTVPLSDRQYGFTTGRSTEDAWNFVLDTVRQCQRKYMLGIFIDFKGAFDHLTWSSIMRRLREVGCPDLALWESYFSERQAQVVGVREIISREVERGCPQGSVLGPYIWKLVMDPLLSSINNECQYCAFADDLSAFVEGDSRAALEAAGARMIEAVRRWADSCGVSISADKTVMMLVKGPSFRRAPCIRVGGTSYKYVSTVKYLGITVGERLNFTPHLDRLRLKLSNVSGQLKRVLRQEWGLSRRAVRTIYKGLFVACATYGSSVWYEFARTALGRRKCDTCHRTVLLACLPTCHTVSTEALQVLLGALPLDLEVMRRGITYKIKKNLPLADSDWLTSDDIVGKSSNDVKRMLAGHAERLWQDRWVNSSKGRVTFGFISDVTFATEEFGFSMSLGFLLTGHGSLNAFLHKRTLSDTMACHCGNVCEDWCHVLCECPLYDDIRNLDSMGIVRRNGEFDVSTCLNNRENLVNLNTFAVEVFQRRRRQIAVLEN